MNIPEGVREEHYRICKECEARKFYARKFDVHFDWIDCIYECENDIDHYEEENKKEEE